MSTIEDLVFGRDKTPRIVDIEDNDFDLEIFTESEEGIVESTFVPYKHWILANRPVNLKGSYKLGGSQYYRYMNEFESKSELYMHLGQAKRNGVDYFKPGNNKECAQLRHGYTYFKGMRHTEPSILSFDIESSGLKQDDNSFIILISNTFRKLGRVERKLFSYEDYGSQGEMLLDWCKWVREINPSIMTGHSIFMYDLPYMNFIAQNEGIELDLGRNGSSIRFDSWESKFRKDGNMFISYNKAWIYGRSIIDTMFLAYKYDIGRKYNNYGLKNIVKQEGLEVKGRQFYDAATIRDNYKDPKEFEKIKKYAIHDADDSLALYDLMSPIFFYQTQTVPKCYQEVATSASGSQLNAMMVRSYLQENKSIPQATEREEYVGAISKGFSGIYRNCYKWDIASMYPHIMLEYEVCDKEKDPQQNSLKILEYLTTERLKNKKLAKETNDAYYDALQNCQKASVNSFYGFLGSTGLNFNSPSGAAYVTKVGRDILNFSMKWLEEREFQIVNCDTDGILFCKKDQTILGEQETSKLLKELNDVLPTKIKFEDDGIFPKAIVAKAKNYILYDGKKITIKGSAFKSSTKEIALKEFFSKIIDELIGAELDYSTIYQQYVNEIMEIQDIYRWCSKKTISSKVLTSKRTNESKIRDAIQGEEVSEGDKVHVYFKEDDSLGLAHKFDGNYNRVRLLKKLHSSAKIFSTVINTKELFLNYGLKKNIGKLKETQQIDLF